MEIQILHWFESLHNPILNPIMYAVTTLGDKGIIWILLAFLCMFLLPKKYRKVGFTMFIALCMSVFFCNILMKNIWHRPRCFWLDGQFMVISDEFENLYNIFAGIDDYSFPSGHTSASFAAALAVFMWRKREGVWAIVLAALISVSRLYLTVHYPSDVLVSLVLGCLYGIAAYFIAKWLFKKFPKFGEVMEGRKPYKALLNKEK